VYSTLTIPVSPNRTVLDSLRAYYVFAQVAEAHSFSRAAERLGITKSAVSKHVAQLEADLAVQLIVRTTRKLVLTEAGERVYASCANIASDLEAAREAAHAQSGIVAGKLRVAAPQALGRNYLIPVVMEFLGRHPQLSIELLFDDDYLDLMDQRIDIALRVGGIDDQTLVSRRLAKVELLLVAAPSYLSARGTPRTPGELADHEWLIHLPSRGRGLTMRRGKQAIALQPQGRLACNNGPSNLVAALAGQGLFLAPDFEVAPELREGSLIRVVPGWTIEQRALHMVFPPRRHVLGRVRAFASFLVERFHDPPWRTRS
jgi:DNA-binding transcriptional LysR family regulator